MTIAQVRQTLKDFLDKQKITKINIWVKTSLHVKQGEVMLIKGPQRIWYENHICYATYWIFLLPGKLFGIGLKI